MKSKMVSFAYPSSDLARKFKMNETGCWFIALYSDINSWEFTETLKEAFKTPQQAIEFADTLHNPYHFSHAKYLLTYIK